MYKISLFVVSDDGSLYFQHKAAGHKRFKHLFSDRKFHSCYHFFKELRVCPLTETKHIKCPEQYKTLWNNYSLLCLAQH